MTRAAILVVAGLAACHAAPDAGPVAPASPPPEPPPVEPAAFTGLVSIGFETESFQPCSGEGRWWITEPGALPARYADVAQGSYEPVVAVVKGTLGPEGRYGHMGGYTRELSVTDVLDVHRPAPGECGWKPPPSAPPP